MHKLQKLHGKWSIQLPRTPMRKMPCVLINKPPSMGIPTAPRTKILLGCDILHSYFLPGTLTRILQGIKKAFPTLHQTDAQTRRLTTTILYLYGVRVPIWSTPLPWYILQSHRNIRASAHRRRKNLLNRPKDQRRVGPRVNLFKGLSLFGRGNEHNALRSQLHFEKQMELLRHSDESRMGPTEQEALHRPSSGETLLRRTRHANRLASLKNTEHYPGQIQDGWQKLENPT